MTDSNSNSNSEFIAFGSLKFRMKTVQSRALVCLNNMLSTIEVDQLGGPETIKLLWERIIEIAFQNNGNTSFYLYIGIFN